MAWLYWLSLLYQEVCSECLAQHCSKRRFATFSLSTGTQLGHHLSHGQVLGTLLHSTQPPLTVSSLSFLKTLCPSVAALQAFDLSWHVSVTQKKSQFCSCVGAGNSPGCFPFHMFVYNYLRQTLNPESWCFQNRILLWRLQQGNLSTQIMSTEVPPLPREGAFEALPAQHLQVQCFAAWALHHCRSNCSIRSFSSGHAEITDQAVMGLLLHFI